MSICSVPSITKENWRGVAWGQKVGEAGLGEKGKSSIGARQWVPGDAVFGEGKRV